MPEKRLKLTIGTVDPESEHFALLYGEAGRDNLVEVARLGGTIDKPTVELALDLDPTLRDRALSEAKRALVREVYRGPFIAYRPGEPRPPQTPQPFDWMTQLDRECGSLSNLYGDLHWTHKNFTPDE